MSVRTHCTQHIHGQSSNHWLHGGIAITAIQFTIIDHALTSHDTRTLVRQFDFPIVRLTVISLLVSVADVFRTPCDRSSESQRAALDSHE